MEGTLKAIFCCYLLVVVHGQCGRGGITERMGVKEYQSSFAENRCNWVFQPPKYGREFVFVLKFFNLDQGISGKIILPNGDDIPRDAGSNYCRSYVFSQSEASKCWLDKNWSNCPQRTINETTWPPQLEIHNPDRQNRLRFGVLHAYIECFNDNPKGPTITDALTTTTKSTTRFKSTTRSTTVGEHRDCTCSIWKTVTYAVGASLLFIAIVVSILLIRECSKNKKSEPTAKKDLNLNLTTHAASIHNSVVLNDLPSVPDRPEFQRSVESVNEYSSIPMTNYVKNDLYQSYKESSDPIKDTS